MKDTEKKHFICPMKCEGEKVYDKPRDCPVCDMHLIPVDKNGKHAEHHHVVEKPKHVQKGEAEKNR